MYTCKYVRVCTVLFLVVRFLGPSYFRLLSGPWYIRPILYVVGLCFDYTTSVHCWTPRANRIYIVWNELNVKCIL